MQDHDDKDREIRDLFATARRADAEEAPGFHQTIRAARARKEDVKSSWPWARRGFRVAFAGTVGSVAVAGMAFWLVMNEPTPTRVEAPMPPPAVHAEPAERAEPVVHVEPAEQAEQAAPAEQAEPESLGNVGSESARVDVRIGKTSPPPVQPTEALIERVQVVAKSTAVNHDSREVSTKFTGEFVADLPVPGRFYQNVLSLAPGAQDADGYHGAPRPTSFAPEREFSTESYRPIEENGFLAVHENPLSTFSIDVDTASYSNVRRFINQEKLPPSDAVRIEELLNYFSYDDPPPSDDAPFSARIEIADCPWQGDHRLARIGLKGRTVSRGEFAGSNLVFLIDVSGSMGQSNKLPLLKSALSLLVDQLDGQDQVAIVVYAGASGLALPSTPGSARGEIKSALSQLASGGSTNGGAGLALAYKTARENFIEGGINRVILATDGDFNVGTTSQTELLQLIEQDAKNGIFLTALGFGMGNYKDDTLEHLANRGNGNFAYIDDLKEARKVLVEQIGGTLITIAKDVKIQVEFNPAQVGAYRLIGYENRMLRKEEFNDDKKDAGEIGAGHSVTALYELVPPGAVETLPPAVDALKYQTPTAPTREAATSDELLTLKLRYKAPDGDTSRLLSFAVVDEGQSLAAASADFKFAAAVAGFGMLLRDSEHRGTMSFDEVQALAQQGLGVDQGGYRAEFLSLAARAQALAAGSRVEPAE